MLARMLGRVIWVVLVLGLGVSAEAEIYKYQTDEGEIVFTTEPRDDLKLIEIIGGSNNGSQPRKTSKKKKRSSSKATATASVEPRVKRGGREDAYDAIIRDAAEAYSMPFAFIKAVMKVESNFNPNVVSHAGAQGLMQLMPITAEEVGCEDPFDPRQNIFGGTKYLRMMTNRYNGDINLVLSAYNAGPGNVDKFSGIPFEGTREYVQKVYHWYQVYESQEGGEQETTP